MTYTIQPGQRIAKGALTHAHQEWDGGWYIEVDIDVDNTAPEWGRSIFAYFVPSVGTHEIGDAITVIEELNGYCYIRETE